MGLHQPRIVYDLPEMDTPAVFTSVWAGRDEEKALKHTKEFLGRALRAQGRHDVNRIVDSVRIVRPAVKKVKGR